MLLKGKIEIFTPTHISGWLAAFGGGDERIRLELLIDGVPIGVASAEGFRPDIAALNYGDGNCEFDFRLSEPLRVSDVERLQLRIVETDLCLELPRSSVWDGVAPGNAGDAAPSPVAPGAQKVFIIGSPRTGTSVLLRGIQTVFGLPAHGESHVIPALAKAVFALRSYYEQFERSPADLLIREMPIDRMEESLLSEARNFYSAIYGNSGWVDKTPSDDAVHSATLIPRLFPDARILVTQRNGIEVVDSYRRKFGGAFHEACENWARVMDGIDHLRDQHLGFLEVDQFNLANAPYEVGRQISSYLGRPEMGAHLGAYLAASREDSFSLHDWRQRLTLEKVDWSEDERATFIRICGEYASPAAISE